MFTIHSSGVTRNCEGLTRRDLLRIGTLGIGGLTLPGLLRLKAAAAQGGPVVKDRSVVLLFLQGGPTHIETFDPKMTAPAEYRAMFGEVKTALPGVTFGSHFPGLAQRADRLAVIRSFRHGISSHGPASEYVASGGNSLKASMGTLYGRIAGATNPRTGIPTNAVITPKACGPKYDGLSSNAGRVSFVGSLPPAYKAFDPSAGGEILNNMKLRIDEHRLDDRRGLLTQLDGIRRQIDVSGALDGADKFQQQAFDVILGGVSDAFDISKEDPRTIARYDTSKFTIPPNVQRKKKNVPGQSPIALGRQMLMARRLCEAGCGFVTVTSAGWDMHGNAFGINDGMPLLGSAVDKTVCAFLDDVAERGLSERILLVITGEFGRTPRINKKAGRDHWGNLCTLAFAGGGLRMGQVIGASDRSASTPATEPVSSGDVMATVMHSLLDIGELRIARGIPSDVSRVLTGGQPIELLV